MDWLPLPAHSLWWTKEGEVFSSAVLVIIEHTCNACYQSCLNESFLPLHMSISSVASPLGHQELSCATYCFQTYVGVEILHFPSFSISLLAVMCVGKAVGDIRFQLFQVTAAGFVPVTLSEFADFHGQFVRQMCLLPQQIHWSLKSIRKRQNISPSSQEDTRYYRSAFQKHITKASLT